MLLVPFVSALLCEPSGSQSQMFSAPLRSDRKTMCLPSGDQRGCESKLGPEVIRVAAPPVIGIVYRSPSNSKTMVLPSGDTSRDIHVPSDVSKLTLRVIGNGSESSLILTVSRFVVSGRGGGGGGCCRAKDTATSRENMESPDGRTTACVSVWRWRQGKRWSRFDPRPPS